MRICIVGGIFGKSAAYQAVVGSTPETTLAEALAKEGHTVVTASHDSELDYHRFDVVHVHHLGPGALKIAVDRSDCRFVFTRHSAATGLTRRIAEVFVTKRADAVVDLARELQAARINADTQYVTIPNGTPEGLFPLRKTTGTPTAGRPFHLLYVGQLIPLKRVDLLIRAIASVSERHDVRLDLVYQVDAEKDNLRRLAIDLGIADRVTFVGGVDQRVLHTHYHRAEALVLPSSTEYLPGVVSEAMMCGTPVVATKVGGVATQLGGHGILIEPNDKDSLIRGLEELIANYPRYTRQSAEMASRARREYSSEAYLRRHLSLYQRVVQAGGPTRKHFSNWAAQPLQVMLRLRRAYRHLQRGRNMRLTSDDG